jgi:hypothetical protein
MDDKPQAAPTAPTGSERKEEARRRQSGFLSWLNRVGRHHCKGVVSYLPAS